MPIRKGLVERGDQELNVQLFRARERAVCQHALRKRRCFVENHDLYLRAVASVRSDHLPSGLAAGSRDDRVRDMTAYERPRRGDKRAVDGIGERYPAINVSNMTSIETVTVSNRCIGLLLT